MDFWCFFDFRSRELEVKMAEILDNMVRDMTGLGDVKCRTGSDGSALGGDRGKLPDVVGGDIEHEQAERKKKPRRRKAKRKNPYQKVVENRGKKNMRLRESKMYNQPVAPYNSNQFLIEDHNDLQDFDVKLMAAATKLNGDGNPVVGQARTGRVRDVSFTSAESDDDFFYSSPEDEEEFLSKEFSNTYRDLHVESLMNMAKPELIQTILQLEEKVDSLQKRLESEGEQGSSNDGKTSPKSLSSKSPSSVPHQSPKSPDPTSQFQTEIAKLVLANQRLVSENARLRENSGSGGGRGGDSSSSEDSESDSSSSSATSGDEEMPSADEVVKMNGDSKSAPGTPRDNT